MINELYDTIRGIIFYELPKNNHEECVIFDQPIKGWYYGDRTILSETPAIVVESQSSPPKFKAFGAQEIEHQIKISCWTRGDKNDILEKNVLEFTRLVYEAMLNHRRMWIMTKCPLCLKGILSPEHYIIAHSDILGAYADAASASGSYTAKAKYAFASIWAETHSGSAPALSNSGLATDAFYLFWDDMEAETYTGGALTQSQEDNITAYQTNKVIPIKLFYDTNFTDIKPATQNNDGQLFRGGEFSLSTKELRKITAYGPDNISTEAWS